MKLILLSVLALSSAVLGQRNPNPCLGVLGNGQFRNDWSSCGDYFWCNFGVAVPVPTPCPPGWGFDEPLQACTIQAGNCDRCPVEGVIAVSFAKYYLMLCDLIFLLQVADTLDIHCQRFYICSNGGIIEIANACGPGTRFNRVTGSSLASSFYFIFDISFHTFLLTQVFAIFQQTYLVI